MPARTLEINLLTQDEFSNSSLGKVMLWALSIGRYIVVFTELIVILSFLSRFKLDRDLTDLTEEIARQKAIIQSYGDLETRFNHVQEQLSLVRLVRGGTVPKDVLNLLTKITPPDVKLSNLTVNRDTFILSAEALSPQGFSLFIKSLSLDPSISQVDVTNVAAENGENTINFSLTATRK